MKVAVIGAGAAGMTAAYELTKGGAEVEVFEASDGVGGMARSIRLWDQTVDLGPHRFFSSDARINRLWLEVVGDDFRMVDRLTRIFYRRRFFYYPLQPRNALWNMGLAEAIRCVVSYAKEKCRSSSGADAAESFESWVVGRFGRRLFEMFFKSYSEKLWGIPCNELDADFAAQRIKKFSLGQAIQSALGLGGKQHKTLVDRFAYPLGGTGMVYQRMAEYVRAHGGKVHTDTPVARVLSEPLYGQPSGGCRALGVELADLRRFRFDHVVSTMPLTLMIRGLAGVPQDVQAAADSLTYRNTTLVYLLVDGSDLFGDQWLYVHSPELLMGRMTNFRNWVPELYGNRPQSILALEYWCSDQDALWSESDAALVARATQEVRSTGLVRRLPVLDGRVIHLHRSYPVYGCGYKKHLAVIEPFLDRCQGLTVIGRYGAFKYNNQDHSILMGQLVAQNLLGTAKHDLWSVNTDYDSYQESATIEELHAKMAA
jgi:protoporphyrinogen oxidase